MFVSTLNGTTAPTPEQESEFAAQFDEFGEEKTAEAEPAPSVNKGMNFWNFVTVCVLLSLC